MNWRRFFRRDPSDAEQREELDFYLDVTAEEYIARGMTPDEARAAARRKLGNTTLIREEVYRMNTVTLLESAWRDARHALRMIRTKPGFSIPALLSLALGIGGNIAIFSVVNAVLIRPLPYPEPDALVGVFNSAVFERQPIHDMPLSLGMYHAYENGAQSFQDFGVWTAGAATITGAGDPEQIATVTMTNGVLPALGVRPYLGRWFSREDNAERAQETAILSYGYWQRRFGGDAHVVGRVVLIDFVPHQVIGVMPRTFQFLNLAPDVLLPQHLPDGPIRSDEFNHSGIARLKPGVTVNGANQDIARVLALWGGADDVRQVVEQLRFKPQLRPLKQDVVGDAGVVLRTLMGALALVLLLVCANVANLVQVRTQSRRREFAIRAALGAGWGRIARELLVESLTLGILGGALGLGFAYAGIRLLVADGSANLPRLAGISIDSASLLFALACSAASSLAFGSIAILKSGRTAAMQNARGASASSEQLRAQNALVVAQVGLALVLLIGAGLMIRSFLALRSVAPGFTHPEQIETVRILIPKAQIPEPERVVRMQADLVARLASIPGVAAAGFASGLPMELEYHNGNVVAVEGRTPVGQIPPNRTTKQVSPGLFAAQGTRLIVGRDFTWDDVFSQRRIAIVSENMAHENWGDPRDALGKRIRIGEGPWMEVVGVVENVHDDGVDRPAPPTVYLRAGIAAAQPGTPAAVRRSVTLAIRSNRAATESFLREITAAIHAVNPNLPLAKVRTLNDVYRGSMARTSFALVLLGIAGAMALTLAVVGVYGVLAYAVAQRRREMSIRVALGAEPGLVQALFVRQGLMLACAGGALGLCSAAALSRWISSLLFGVAPLDPLTYGVSGAIILAAAVTASYIPARRAASVDPMETLRSD
ncbi:MAG: ABC transporter permease [Acidobacteriia bacterium]|nr:ABC transporter permease [Terriglobia bacterium]